MLAKRSKQPQQTLPLPHIPFDLVAEILCRLPAKHLIQLRCICKLWNSLISRDSNFAKKHLCLSTSNHERHHLILTPNYFPYYTSPDFLLLHSPISSIFTSTFTPTIVKHFTYSITQILNKRKYGTIASTCDGMVCFKIDNSSALLCNPFIRKFKLLPPFKFPNQTSTQIFYTLVHDRFINNYKIIAVNWMRSSKIEVHIHTLGTDYWRRIQDFSCPKLILVPRPGTFVNDSVNWLVSAAAPFIVSLALEKESYQNLSLPDDISSLMTLGTLRGCLSLLYDRSHKFSDIWIMKEYGNENSWTKLLTVPHTTEFDFNLYTGALYISEDDKVVMECKNWGKNSLVVYDSINNTFEVPKFKNNIDSEMTPGVYVESLISPL